MLLAFFDRTPTVFRLVSMKNTFLPFNKEFLTFFRVGLHFLKVGLLGGELGAVEGLRKLRIEFVLVFVSFIFKLVWFLKFHFLDLFHLHVLPKVC